ncbi:GmrSD restriction endonuclease domain-containing protein [Actinopolyspora saharensis]|uniref:DUF262 domain-containing protein n=1 Tax=Actinopolyspora saharensis TaxID=995062 RepID=A0A1H0YHN1_9ACTN|nr:DUF262 domain-containing protein [Actinopolyspora saharensis]SDQ14745.1 Protein of unknown function [Actinopolyspora saharensis]
MTESANSVDLIPIESKTRTIQTCFQQCLYEVPNFQREYSWSPDQLRDFWNDVVLAQSDLFFGSTVTWVSERRDLFNDTYSIIDGQQRLTTSAIILSVVRDAFYRVSEHAESVKNSDATTAKSQASATQRYLIATDDDGNSYPILKRSEPMFYEHIQNPSAIPSRAKWNSSAERIGEARSFFEKRVIDELGELSLDDQIERLKTIRANVLKARVIQVELTSEEDGFLIFETLNTRGTDLRLSDLVKNLLIRGGATSAPDRQAIADRWQRVVDRVQEAGAKPDVVDRFIWQSWNSRRSAVKVPELYKEISRFVGKDPTNYISYLEELEVDSFIYEWLEKEDIQPKSNTHDVRNAFAVPEFVDSIRALAIFNVSVANSTVLAIARKHHECQFVKQSQLIEVMRLVENFHFQFSALTNSGSTGGTRSRYNRFAVRLEAASSSEEVKDAISDLKSRLRDSLPARDQTEKAFRGLFYAPSLKLNQKQKSSSRKIFIAYVLMAFALSRKIIPAGQNLTSWSIEHIKPQTMGTGSSQDHVYSIGNLTLLTSELNNELGKAPLSAKMKSLRKGSAYFDSELESWEHSGVEFPSESQISERSSLLTSEALDQVWTL